jgi:hypothetical protein
MSHMDTQRASRELAVIRELMERPVRYSTMSGAAGVFAGATALVGVWADDFVWRSLPLRQAMLMEVVVWGAVFLVALAGAIVLTRLRERKMGLPFWTYARKRVLRSIAPPFLAFLGLTLAILARWYMGLDDFWGMIPPIWMACYGLACCQVSEFSLGELRVLGAAFILSAVVAVFLPEQPYATLGITFGGYHIIYGVVVWVRHGG